MKTRAIILAGGEGTRLSVLTFKRTKPAVPFAGKYRIIDFPLSNCVNSNIFDVVIIAQYRPQSLIEHIGAGGPWDLDREFTGGLKIFTPYKARGAGWFIGTADAVQQNFAFIKRSDPDLILILSGDHVYKMDYDALIRYHLEKKAAVTLCTIQVPLEEASRFGIVSVDENQRVTSFVEKPADPTSNLVNMGVYLFTRQVLDDELWKDHLQKDSSHDFGKDILPKMVAERDDIYAYPFSGYWVDVGTVNSYWQAHMDLLCVPPTLDLHTRGWVVHTRSEERPPANIQKGARVEDSLVCDGCIIEDGACVYRSVLSPGVIVRSGAVVHHSILLTDTQVQPGAVIKYAIVDKRSTIGEKAVIGGDPDDEPAIALVGKNSVVPPGTVIQPGAVVGTDVIPPDYTVSVVQSGQYIQTRRLPNEL